MRLTRLPSPVRLTRLPDPVLAMADPVEEEGIRPEPYSDFDHAAISAYFDSAVPEKGKGLLDARPWTGRS